MWVAALPSHRFGSRHLHGGNHVVFPSSAESPIGINFEKIRVAASGCTVVCNLVVARLID